MRMSRRHRLLRALAGAAALALVTGCGPGAAAPVASEAPSTAESAPSLTTAATPPVTLTTPTARPTTTPAAFAPWPVPADASLPEERAAELQDRLDDFLLSTPSTGVVAAVVTEEGAWTGVVGADGEGTPLVPEAAFGIGSTTKAMTAAEVMLLASRGAIDLDAPVTDYVALPFDAHGATVRQVATMRSGFPGVSNEDDEAAAAADLARRWTVDELLQRVKDNAPAGTLGGPGMYNGTNYQVLGKVIETVTGDNLAAALRADLFEPAGLERIWTQVDEQPVEPLAVTDDRGAGIVDDSGWLPSRAAASMGNGAAGIAADAPTLARFGYLLYGGRIIDPVLVSEMTFPNPASQFSYGIGTMFDTGAGGLVVGHAGDFMGYSAVMIASPKLRIAVAVLAPRGGLTNSTDVPACAFDLLAIAARP